MSERNHDLHALYDDLCAQMEPVQRKCNETYLAWTTACAEWKDLSRRRAEVWIKMMDEIVSPPAGTGE